MRGMRVYQKSAETDLYQAREETALPVLGHAFVGLALGVWTQPDPPATIPSPKTTTQVALWTPIIIGLSYLPDVLAQLALLLGAIDARQITHALPSALIVSLLATPIMTRIVQASIIRNFVSTLVAITLHDTLDLLQATDRMLWWPLSHRAVWHSESLLPTTPIAEAVVFGFPCILAIIIRYFVSPTQNRILHSELLSYSTTYERYCWRANIAATAVLLGAATITQHLRQVREDQLDHARHTAQERYNYEDALALLDGAERWPSTAKPGRVDYLRGWIYSQMGNRKQAEEYYLRSLRADPNYFWAVADFALFYASAPENREVRQQRVAPYLRRLQEDFAYQPQLKDILVSISLALNNLASTVKNLPKEETSPECR